MITEYFCLQLRQTLQAAVPVSAIQEVLNLTPTQICPVPGVDPVLQGVVNWRGKLLWSLHLSDLLKLRTEKVVDQQAIAASTLTTVVIAQDNPARQLACIVLALKGVQEIVDSEIQPLAEKFPAAVHQYASGFIRQESPLLLLKPAAILNASRWQRSTLKPG